MTGKLPGILFVCTHNACRSIVCEAVTRELAGQRISVASAGSCPAGRIHPLTLEYLKTTDYSAEGLYSKSLDDVVSFQPDIVITVCDSAASEACPAGLSSAATLHWGFADPTAIAGNREATKRAFDTLVRSVESRIQAVLDTAFEEGSTEGLAAALKTENSKIDSA